MNRKKKYNKYTKGYKIDIYANQVYVGSTDMYKTCKQAKAAYIQKHPEFCRNKEITCHFDYAD